MIFKEQIINRFNSGAYTYDMAADVQRIVAHDFAARLPDISAQTILEIGCGTGLFSQHLVQHFPSASLILTDIAPAMVDICQARFVDQANVDVICMDGEAVTLPASFDLIFSCMTMHWFADIKNSLLQLSTKLARGGRIFFAMLGENSLSEWRKICQSCDVIPPTPRFPSAREIKKAFPTMTIQVDVLQQYYPSTFYFLQKMKLIGAHTPHPNHTPFCPGKLRSIMRNFDKKYPHGLTISYEIIYGSYTKI